MCYFNKSFVIKISVHTAEKIPLEIGNLIVDRLPLQRSCCWQPGLLGPWPLMPLATESGMDLRIMIVELPQRLWR